VGPVREGDEVIVNVDAADLGLGSGGFDLVHANLSRGLDGDGADRDQAMKLNYTPLQHTIDPVEARNGEVNGTARVMVERPIPVRVLSLGGQPAPAAGAAHRRDTRARIGYIQTEGGALPGRLSRDVSELRRAGLICSQITAGPAYGGDLEAMTVAGALQAAAGPLEWDAAIAGPGPGIVGSGTALGHGGLAALGTAPASLALRPPTPLAPRVASGGPPAGHPGRRPPTQT